MRNLPPCVSAAPVPLLARCGRSSARRGAGRLRWCELRGRSSTTGHRRRCRAGVLDAAGTIDAQFTAVLDAVGPALHVQAPGPPEQGSRPKAHRTRFTGKMGRSLMAQSPATMYSTRSCRCDHQDGRRDRRRDGKGKSAGDVEHTEILGRIALVAQHVHHEREVDGRVHPKPRPLMACDEEPLKLLAMGPRTTPAVHDRRGQDEDLARPVRSESFPR